ncbi:MULTISPECIES: hypothetical protein [unclassified Bradyrhizobium]|nr:MULTISPECIES: hypothetical protein [unclassified Bradyrhizobium]MCK1709674.1 hypothetical protein [Bradyrhizobium sp. 143]MCK1725003.1 hypothetical protein [Bradyrhizobium sp. 142]
MELKIATAALMVAAMSLPVFAADKGRPYSLPRANAPKGMPVAVQQVVLA